MKICLFDIDGTLISSGGAGRAAFYATLEAAFDLPAPHHEVSFAGRTDRSIIGDLFALHAIDDTPENAQRFFRAYLQILPDMLSARGGTVLPGIGPLVKQLSERDDVAVGLLTGNTHSGAKIKLGHYGLFDFFRFGGFGEVHRNRDAVAADALVAAREFLGTPIDPRDTWVIGDTPLDVRCARSIGARVVAVATGGSTLAELAAFEPDLLLSDLSDPTPLLESWR